MVELYQNRDKTQLENTYEFLSLDNNNYDFYDYFYFDNTILSTLRKSGFSQDYLMSCDLLDIFINYLSIQDANLLEQSNKWFLDLYQDCDREASYNVSGQKSDSFSKEYKLIELLEKKLKVRLRPDDIIDVWDLYDPHILKQYSIRN